jgi:hypothetical protein
LFAMSFSTSERMGVVGATGELETVI